MGYGENGDLSLNCEIVFDTTTKSSAYFPETQTAIGEAVYMNRRHRQPYPLLQQRG